MPTKSIKETPLMKQYNAIKVKYPGAMLLFRVGDFYETFGEDAIKASKILDIVLTKRANGSSSFIELAGFPYHAMENYLPKLVRAGNRVAICDQLEDPKMVKGIVKRGVTELVTPGLSYNDNVLDTKRNNYLASISFDKHKLGIAFLDLSTGEFMVAEGTTEYITKLIQSFSPTEILYAKPNRILYETLGLSDFSNFALDDWTFSFDYGYESLTNHFNTSNLKGYGVNSLTVAIGAAGAILTYLKDTEHKKISHINSISKIAEEKYMWLDKFTIRNLELNFPQLEGGVPLIDVLDYTVTPMGGRMIKKWLVLPLKDKLAIESRLGVVEILKNNSTLLNEIVQNMNHIGDLERLISKVAVSRINPREMVLLKHSLNYTLLVKNQLINSKKKELIRKADILNKCELLLQKIENELNENPPLLLHQGGIIKQGIHAELDELRLLAFSGKDYLKEIREREVKLTGISSLKIGYNKVFGYYLEVSNAHKDKVPNEWVRKQTLVNAERYITEELKLYEEKILNAEGKSLIIEQELFQNIVLFANEYILQIQQNAHLLATIDCLCSFASVAIKNKYVLPTITNSKAIDIKKGRHPVIEKQLPLEDPYIPNDIYLDNSSQQILIITGPNMAGKSALLRQVALIVLMAQMGSFVPASSASIGLVDKLFTRVGASDNLSQGESTFMIEMTETASILNNLSDKSLILMDEIGRGTSTYDGVSIAWSIVEYLHNATNGRAKTLFATHYHELNQLEKDFPRIKNFNVSVKEIGNKILFMRKLKPGGSEHSFGIHVAKMAGIPNSVVLRANEIMHFLEKDKNKKKEKITNIPKNNFQLIMFETDHKVKEVQELLSNLDINTISPVEALLKLNEIKGKLTSE